MRLCLAVLSMLAATACGGDSGVSPPDGVILDVRPIVLGTTEGTHTLRSDAPIRAGTAGTEPLRIVLRFAMPEMPEGATLVRATFELNELTVLRDTYDTLGALEVHASTFGSVVDATAGSTPSQKKHNLSTDGLVSLKTWTATQHILDLIEAGAEFIDLRIQFQNDSGSFATPFFSEFDSDSGGSGGTAVSGGGPRLYWQLAY